MLKKTVIAILTVMMAMSLFSCGKDEKGKSDDGKDTAGSKVDFKLVIGANNEFGKSLEGVSLVYDFLLSLDDKGEPAPNIIKEWKIGNEAKEYTLVMNKGIKFHDGTPLTPDIIKKDIEFWGPIRHSNYMKSMDKIEVQGDDKLRVTFKKPYTVFLKDISKIHVTKPGDVDQLGNIKNYNGTGPFTLDKSEGTKAFLKRNDNYWNKGSKPKVKNVEWISIPDNNARILALKSGKVDVLGVSEHYNSVPYQYESEFMKNKNFKMIRNPFVDVQSYSLNWLKGPLQDVNLRKALNYGIDRKNLVKKLFYGIPKDTAQYVNPKYVDGPKNQVDYSYDIEKAKKLIAKAGYKDTDKDGIVEKDGKPLSLVMTVRDDKESKDVAVYVQNDLKKIGVDVQIKSNDKKVTAELQKKGDFDIASTHPWKSPLINHMRWRGLLKGYDDFGAGYNVDPKLEKLTDDLGKAKNPAEVSKIANEIWKIEYDFAPVISLFTRDRCFVFNKKFSGFAIRENNMLIDLSKVEMK